MSAVQRDESRSLRLKRANTWRESDYWASEEQTMCANTRQLSRLTGHVVLMVVLIVGGLPSIWAQCPAEGDLKNAMSASAVSVIAQKYDSSSAGEVWNTSEMTRREDGAAPEVVVAAKRAACRDEVERLRFAGLAMSVGVCCWLLAILSVTLLNAHCGGAGL